MEFKENNAGKQFDPDLPPEWQKQMSQIKSTVNKTVVRSVHDEDHDGPGQVPSMERQTFPS